MCIGTVTDGSFLGAVSGIWGSGLCVNTEYRNSISWCAASGSPFKVASTTSPGHSSSRHQGAGELMAVSAKEEEVKRSGQANGCGAAQCSSQVGKRPRSAEAPGRHQALRHGGQPKCRSPVQPPNQTKPPPNQPARRRTRGAVRGPARGGDQGACAAAAMAEGLWKGAEFPLSVRRPAPPPAPPPPPPGGARPLRNRNALRATPPRRARRPGGPRRRRRDPAPPRPPPS